MIDAATAARARRHLKKADPIMARLIAASDHDFEFDRQLRRKPHFHTLVVSIINQQLSVKAGSTIAKRVLALHGGQNFQAVRMLELNEEALRQCGVSKGKCRYLHALSKAVETGAVNFRKLARADDDAVRHALTQVPGIGRWSADMFLMFSLYRLDVFPVGDLALRKAVQHHYALDVHAPHDDYLTVADAWRPYRSIASRYLWRAGSG